MNAKFTIGNKYIAKNNVFTCVKIANGKATFEYTEDGKTHSWTKKITVFNESEEVDGKFYITALMEE